MKEVNDSEAFLNEDLAKPEAEFANIYGARATARAKSYAEDETENHTKHINKCYFYQLLLVQGLGSF